MEKYSNRKIKLLPSNYYKSIVVIIDKAEQIRHNKLHQLFPAAKFSFLTLRIEKTDDSSGLNYTLHKTDFKLGKLKNDRLKTLIKSDFDLLIDLSEHKKLSYFTHHIQANLKAGCFNKNNNQNFDLLVRDNNIEQVMHSIAKQIDKLTLNIKQ